MDKLDFLEGTIYEEVLVYALISPGSLQSKGCLLGASSHQQFPYWENEGVLSEHLRT